MAKVAIWNIRERRLTERLLCDCGTYFRSSLRSCQGRSRTEEPREATATHSRRQAAETEDTPAVNAQTDGSVRLGPFSRGRPRAMRLAAASGAVTYAGAGSQHSPGGPRAGGSRRWSFPGGRCGGFGPFGEHAVNASWIAVQELEKLGLGDGVDLYVYEIPVEYQTVQRLIPALWKKHSPQLVVHVGVSGMATTVTLEKCGHNVGYKGLDNCRFCPGSQCCVEGGPECIDSIIDMDAVCRRVSTLGLDVTVTISKDAGRYLCDFTYYTSLYQSHGRSAFVHVPPLGKPYTAEQLGRALQAIIEEMLDVLEHSEGKINCRHEH
nr:pyroglutamyl-peptidase 1 [Chelonoidis abingdonii]